MLLIWKFSGKQRPPFHSLNTVNSQLTGVMVGGHGQPKITVKTKLVKTWYKSDEMQTY
jgi:hypothetical protein